MSQRGLRELVSYVIACELCDSFQAGPWTPRCVTVDLGPLGCMDAVSANYAINVAVLAMLSMLPVVPML
jgi:hypothetical protein